MYSFILVAVNVKDGKRQDGKGGGGGYLLVRIKCFTIIQHITIVMVIFLHSTPCMCVYTLPI